MVSAWAPMTGRSIFLMQISSRTRRIGTRVLRSSVIGLVGGLLGVFFMQRWLIYHPQSEPVDLPSSASYQGLQDIRLQAADGIQLHAWYWPSQQKHTAILFMHGNGGDRSGHRTLYRDLHTRGYTVLSLDYRGYGGSAGSPSEDGLYLDAEAAARWLAAAGHDRVVYFGESLGTAVAIELAQRRPPQAIVLQAPFDSMMKVAKYHFPWLPVRWLLTEHFDSIAKITAVKAPLLIIHGDRDATVPQVRGRALFEAALQPKTWISVPGAGHNDIRERLGDAYLDAVESFLSEHARP